MQGRLARALGVVVAVVAVWIVATFALAGGLCASPGPAAPNYVAAAAGLVAGALAGVAWRLRTVPVLLALALGAILALAVQALACA